jgi:hypothetical protein
MIQTLRDNCLHANRSQKLDSSAVHLRAVILAGGDGVRLRELTRRIAGDSRPKQFCRIIGEQSLFRETRRRLDPLYIRDRQVFVFSRAHERYYGDDLTDAGDSCVIEQPLNRGTGIAIILALLRILQRDHDALAAFFPCDHFYADQDSFRLTIGSSVECAEHNPESIILVGTDAEYPETDYGWIEPRSGCFERYRSAAFTGISILGEAFVATSPCAITSGLPLEYFRNCRPGDDTLRDVVFASSPGGACLIASDNRRHARCRVRLIRHRGLFTRCFSKSAA